MFRKAVKFLLITGFLAGTIAAAGAAAVGWYYYNRLTRDLPKIERLSDYRPKAVTSIYADDGTLIAEEFEERRYPVAFQEIPQVVKNAFLAAEDANFYRHPGIDIISVIRAVWVNLRSKKTKQGASTITQQIVKSLLLTREKTYERKAKEVILAYRLEKALTKDEIFSIYLNEIFLGAGAYGVKAAAKVHFHKEMNELSIAEAAHLAGLPQKPTELSRLENYDMALQRRRYVVRQMFENRMITEAEYNEAKEEQVRVYPAEQQTIFDVPYFAGQVIKQLPDVFRKIEGGQTPTHPGGFSVQTTASVKGHSIALRSVQRGLRELDKRQGWRGPLGSTKDAKGSALLGQPAVKTAKDLKPGAVYKAAVKSINAKTGAADVQLGALRGTVELKKAGWARRFIKEVNLEDIASTVAPETLLKAGDIIEVSLDGEPKQTGEEKNPLLLQLDQTPRVKGAMVVLNALTGEVKVIIGGYDYQESQFNRATQAELQPGSSFKPFIYLTALETLHYTPSTIVPDSPISMMGGDGKMWTPGNFDHKYLGPITLRTALQRSRNVVSVYLTQLIGVNRVIQTARRLGITTPIQPNMSIALGTPEVRLIEMVRAYGAFAAEGWLADQLLIKSIKDRDGKVIYRQSPHQEKVVDDTEAFLMANMMKGVVERGTGQKVKELGRPVAGKTGTTNDQMDAWFIGYTPEWVGGVWVGFDVKKSLGKLETGGKAAAPIFLYFMQEFLNGEPVLDFNIPDGVVPVPVNIDSGHPVDPGASGAFIEYFKTGTEPTLQTEAEQNQAAPKEYLTSDEF